jgi:3-oxoadipate enol-lactonase
MKLNGVNIYYEEAGRGGSILFLHGFTGSHLDWVNQVNVTSDKYRTIAMDFRGHGQSEAPPNEDDYSIYHFEKDVFALLEMRDVRCCCLVGHSMGGFTALQFVLDHPEMVTGLVLVDTSSGEWDRIPGYAELKARLDEIARRDGIGAAFDYDAANNPMRIERFQKHPELREIARRKALNTSLAGYIHVPGCFQKWRSVTERLHEIKAPTIVFRGEDDTPFIKASDTLINLIPGAELVVVPGASHNPHEENPEFFNRAFLKFLSEIYRQID